MSETVSVLLLSWNSAPLIADALRSVQRQSRPADEILLIDNASQDDTVELAEGLGIPGLEIVCFEKNLGYAGGFNRGLRIARGEFLLLLNPDVRLDEHFIERALEGFEDPRTGIVAGRLMREDGRLVDSTGQFLARSRKTLDRGYGRPHDPRRDAAGPVLSACGAAPLYRREMLEDIADEGAFFDEDYFAFREDLELGWRAWRAGWRAQHVPGAWAVHLRAGGTAAGPLGLALARPPWITALSIRNRHLSVLRHDSLLALLLDLPFWLPREAAQVLGTIALRPKVFGELWRSRRLLLRALRMRRSDRSRKGRWGRWRRDAPPRGVYTRRQHGGPQA